MSETYLGRRYLRPSPAALTVEIVNGAIAGGEEVEEAYETALSGFVWGDDFTLTIDGGDYDATYEMGDDDYAVTPPPPDGDYTGETLSQDGNDWTVSVSVTSS